jgi:hypothetical protein
MHSIPLKSRKIPLDMYTKFVQRQLPNKALAAAAVSNIDFNI